MANLKTIKSKILSYKKTGTVTHAMEAVSAVKMRKSQERALSARAYAASALTILEKLSGGADMTQHPLKRAGNGKTAFIIVTSDKGLAGSLNSGVIRAVEQEIRSRALSKESVLMACIGRKGADYFSSRGYDVRLRKENKRDDVSEADMKEVTEYVLGLHATWEVGAVFIAYTNFISTFEQEPVSRQVVPITTGLIHDIVAGIRPARGRYAGTQETTVGATYSIEPSAESVLNVLLPKLINIAVFHGLLESKASEHSSRMVAMKSATDKAKEMASNLTRTFNKVRQAAITREVSEITSGIEAMR